jgi:putative DNA primase/helicase
MKPKATTQWMNIPEEMRARAQWVCYSLEPAEGSGELTKIPRKPYGGARAKINEPDGWDTFDAAVEASPRYDGVEYMLWGEDPYTFVDLDHCVDDAGKIEEWAQAIINDFDSYTEFSRSGEGIHIICQGKKPGARCRNIKEFPQIELYDHSRPIVMTGDLVPGTNGRIQPAANEIAGLYAKLFPSDIPEDAAVAAGGRKHRKGRVTQNQVTPMTLTDEELITKAISSPRNGAAFCLLWNGNISEYGNDWSAADQALCNHLAFWTAGDAERIDRLFRMSGLYRDKWDRDDYRERTITKAIHDTRNAYTGPQRVARAQETGVNPNTGEVDYIPNLTHLTDLGNAEYMIDIYGAELRFDVDARQWLHWCGSHWQYDTTGEIERIARDTVRSMYDLLKDITDPDKAKQMFGHIRKSESKPRLEAMIGLAQYCPGIPVRSSELDADHWLINCQNGTVDLRTGMLHEHRQSDMIAKMAPINFVPEAQCPRFLQFLDEVFVGDSDIASFAQRMIGYCLTGDTREESIFILYGRGQCGKSKFVEIICRVLGDYVRNTPVTTFVERNDTSTADLASLVGSRLVTASEADEHQAFNEPLLKRISGRDPVTCRHLYKSFFTYVPTFKVVFSTNDVPRIRSQSFAMKRRVKIVPFRQRFYDPEEGKLPIKDDRLWEKLTSEVEGIFAWAVRGCLEWQKNGLQVPPAIRREINRLFDEQDPLAEFIDQKCVLGLDESIEVNKLWREYLEWCSIEVRRPAFKATQWFSKSLTQRDDIDLARGTGGIRMLQGIALRNGSTGNLWDGSTLNSDASDANRGNFEKSPHVRNESEDFSKTAQIASLASLDNKLTTEEDFAQWAEDHDMEVF